MPSREILCKTLHTVVYSTCFSPCGKYLAAGNKYGDIAIFRVKSALSAEASDQTKLPFCTFKVPNGGAVYNLTCMGQQLISAGESGIAAYKWSDLISKNTKLQWSLSIHQKDILSHPEVTSCAVTESKDGHYLFAGSGDHSVYYWDIESGTQLGTLDGHTDFIHAVAVRNQGQGLVSVSEDGSARLWDLRSKQTVNIIKPYEHEMCARPDMGKWLQCLSLDEEDYWLLLGGGPKMSVWHLKTLTPTATFDTPGVAQHVAQFEQDVIYSAGSDSVLNHWTLTGEHKMAVPVTPSSVFSVSISPKTAEKKVMTIAGSSDKIDICTNFGYRAFSLAFAPSAS